MTSGEDDYQRLMSQKRFLGEIEQAIRALNRELIHERIPLIDKDRVVAMARVVGNLRAKYLECAFRLYRGDGGDIPDRPMIEELHARRTMFEEARTAFEALREAIEKGYVEVEDSAAGRRTFQR